MDRKLDSFSERDRFRVNHIHDEATAVLVIRAMCDCFPCCALMSLVDSGIVSLRDATEAFKKSYKPEHFQEEAEQIDELTKSTLGSYVKKATTDAVVSRKVATDFEHKAERAKSSSMKTASTSLANKFKDMARKRQAGVGKAVDRLTKEEVEGIDEVAPPGFEGTVKAMKKHKEIDNPYALAWYMKNKGAKSHRKADGSVKEEQMKSYKQFVESITPIEEEIVDEANAFDWKNHGSTSSSGRYDVKQVGNRTIVTRKYNPETGHSTGTDDDDKPAEKRGRGRPAGSKSGAKQKGSGKSNDYRGVATHSLNLPNTNK